MSRGIQVLLFSVVVVVAASAGFMLSAFDRPGQVDTTRLSTTALPDLSGMPQSIDQWKGKVLVINFWATWCPPCLEEIPHFVRMQSRLGPQGLQFFGIAIDDADKVKRFVVEQGINYPVVIGQIDALELSRSAGNTRGGLPYTLVLDRSGRVVSQHYGGLNEETLIPIVSKLL